MSKFNYVMGMLAVGGAAAATGAQAGSITYTLDLPITSDVTTTSITLLGAATPQYQFGSFANITTPGIPTDDAGLVSYGYLTGATGKSDIGLVFGYTVGGQPLTEAQFAAAYGAKTIPFAAQNPIAEIESGTDGASPPGETDHYTYLVFGDPTSSAGFSFGYAHFSADDTLETITVPDVPEPQSWALLLAGVGLAGGALRQNRRRAAVAA